MGSKLRQQDGKLIKIRMSHRRCSRLYSQAPETGLNLTYSLHTLSLLFCVGGTTVTLCALERNTIKTNIVFANKLCVLHH